MTAMIQDMKLRLRRQRESERRHIKNARSCIRDKNYTEAMRSLLWAAQAEAFGDGLQRCLELSAPLVKRSADR